MPARLPAISGHQLIRLLRLDGWSVGSMRTHGLRLQKIDRDGHARVTVVADQTEPLPRGTLAAILGPRQTGLGRDGLADLIQRHGLH